MYSIKYYDPDNDLITVETEEEFSEAILLSKSLLFIELHSKNREAPPCSSSSSTHPLHRGQRWYQLHREALQLFNSEDQKDLALARSLLLQQFEITPSNPITLYNLACIESRLKNLPSALEYLEKSLQKGYRDFTHIQKDKDLDFIRNSEQFHKLLSSYEQETPSGCSFSIPNQCHRRKRGLWILEKQIHILFQSKSPNDLSLARELLLKQLDIKESAHTLYNLACVESLLKNEQEALSYLRRAIDLGFNKGDHMDKDEDLDNIRHTPNYQLLRDEIGKKKVNREVNEDYEDYEDVLSVLGEMGFSNKSLNLRIVRQTLGNLENALALLLAEKV
jgi:tetratricopeptide (TPR) repeat protein